jgi:sulfate adenylyltransferase
MLHERRLSPFDAAGKDRATRDRLNERTAMPQLVAPHGSETVKPLLLPETERVEEHNRATKLRKIPLDSRALSDVFMLAMGAYTPLDGFMRHDEWRGSCVDMKMTNGLFWPIPITLPVDKELADSIHADEEVALIDAETSDILGVMQVHEKYSIDKLTEAEHIYRTTDAKHPGVAKVLEQGDVNLAGRVMVLSEGEYPARYAKLYVRPAESRAMFLERGWSRVAAFQTRNPMHRSHEHLVKIAVEVLDGVFIHQVLGKLKAGDIPADVRTRTIQVMIDNYFRAGTVIQAGYPIEMRYAGPREALLHALIRQNFGCSHLIVGRDHAGVGDYYGPFDAHHIFDQLWDGALKTKALKIDVTFYCRKCYGMATAKTCPHDPKHHISTSGTQQREMLSTDADIPPEFSRPEVVAILKEYYASLRSTSLGPASS